MSLSGSKNYSKKECKKSKQNKMWWFMHITCRNDNAKEIVYPYNGKEPNVFHCSYCEEQYKKLK